MAVITGTFAHVVGSFDLADRSGSIEFVTPVKTATTYLEGGDERLRLKGHDDGGAVLFDLAANPQHNSCAPSGDSGTYEEFVPVTPNLARIVLLVGGAEAAEFKRGGGQADRAVSFGNPDPSSPNKVPLQAAVPEEVGVSYTVQAKPEGARAWQTIGVGLPTPIAEVDANQFPGAPGVEVRVLRSDGFSEEEVFSAERKF